MLLGFIIGLFAAITWPMLQQIHQPEFYALGATFVFAFFILFGVRYVISGTKVIIKIWFIPFGSVNILEISSLKRTYNILSSPATSLKRLAIYKSNHLAALISPKNEAAFIEELLAINPLIKVDVTTKKEWWRVWDWDI